MGITDHRREVSEISLAQIIDRLVLTPKGMSVASHSEKDSLIQILIRLIQLLDSLIRTP